MCKLPCFDEQVCFAVKYGEIYEERNEAIRRLHTYTIANRAQSEEIDRLETELDAQGMEHHFNSEQTSLKMDKLRKAITRKLERLSRQILLLTSENERLRHEVYILFVPWACDPISSDTDTNGRPIVVRERM